MSYIIKGMGPTQVYGRRIVPLTDAVTYAVYFVGDQLHDVNLAFVAEFINLDDAKLFVRSKES